jgi:predicted DNA-binding transcriptional regulator YafY
MRAGRLVALILAVERRKGATARALAEELEVSERTIYRDVSALQAAGVPLWTEPGPGGGIRLVEGWSAPVDGLTADEATALFVGASGAADLGLGGVLAVARSKVRSALPDTERAAVDRVRERVHLDAPGWFRKREELPALPTIAAALWADRRLDIEYGRPGSGSTVTRRVDPLGLVSKAGTWYLVAAHRGEPRTYRVSRVAAARMRDEAVTRPDGFDLAAHWAQAADRFDAAIRPLTAVLRLAPGAFRMLPRAVPGPATDAALAAAGEPDVDGWRTVTIALEPMPIAAGMLVPLPGVEVVSPPELRAALAAHGAALAAANAGPPPTPA